MNGARWLDLAVILAYMAVLVGVGIRFSRRQTSTEAYFVGKRAVPSWAMGLSLLSTLVSSVTFIAYPGSSYAGDWSLLVPGFLVLGVLILVGSIIIPFYRHAVGMSVYEYFQKRFGRPVRIYASAAFALAHFSKMAFVFYLMALTINSMTGWTIDYVIGAAAAVVICYTLVGGILAVVWTDVIQAFVTWAGVLVCLGYLLLLPEGGPSAVLRVAAENGKFRLGTASWDLSSATAIPVLIIYGFFWYLQRYTADQTVVQRYLLAKSDRSALKGVALGASMCIPVWAFFMLIGTCTWAFYRVTGEELPQYITKADQVFPYFIATNLPAGVAGLFMASLIGATMSMLSSDLNSFSLVGVEDYYRVMRPNSDDRSRLRMAKVLVAVVGAMSAGAAVILAHTRGSALSMWFAVSAIVSGGLAGLFILAFLSRRASSRGIYAGIGASLAFTIWAVLTRGANPLVNLAPFNFPWDDLMIGAVGHGVLVVIGYVASLLLPRRATPEERKAVVTFWDWLRIRKERVNYVRV